MKTEDGKYEYYEPEIYDDPNKGKRLKSSVEFLNDLISQGRVFRKGESFMYGDSYIYIEK